MTEYIIIVALIAIAAIAVFTYFGKTVREQSAGMAQELAGQDGSGAIEAAGEAAGTAATKAEDDKGLSNYGNAGGGE
ncbi:MAG TPA: hypothetical protein VKA64_00770 [Gammaproteobacteria bacterium]|nr:hypothetical protein [Gammaproteobacteria bacterium]